MKYKNILIALGVSALVLTGFSAVNGQSFLGATVCFPFQGCTGTSTLPGLGSLLSGNGNGGYGLLATSTDGAVLTSSSSAPLGVSWQVSGTGITSLNGLTGATQTFATSGASGINISSAGTTHTFNQPTSTASQSGYLSSADWTTFNAKESALTFTTPLSRATNVISIPTSTGSQNGFLTSANWQSFMDKLTSFGGITSSSSAITAGTGIQIATTTSNLTITNGGVTSLVAGSSTSVSNATGTVTVSTQPFSCQWVGYYSTSSTIWPDDFCILNTTSTIKEIWVKQQGNTANTDTITFNLYYASTMPATTSTGAFAVFIADQTITSTSTAKLTPTASSTPGLGNFIRIHAKNASSTEFTMQVYLDR